MSDGWINHTGLEAPTPPEGVEVSRLVEVRFSDGTVECDDIAGWGWDLEPGHPGRIAAFRWLVPYRSNEQAAHAALRELVALKRLKDRKPEEHETGLEILKEYQRRKPAAWAAAFALVDERGG